MAPLEHYAPHQVGDLSDLGGIVLAGSPADFGKRIAVEPEKWATVIRTGHFKPQRN
jgi:hypothetical protein